MGKGFLKKDVSKKEIETYYIDRNASELIGNNENGNESKVIISFIHIQNDFQCFSAWTKQEMDEFWSFYKRVHKYTWEQVHKTGGKNQKSGLAYTIISIDRYPNSVFKKSLSDDVTLFELRVSGKSRVHGFRNKSVFYVCWLDRNHNLLKTK